MIAATQMEGGGEVTALAGVTTPLHDISLPVIAAGSLLAVVSARLGTLSADTSPGAIIQGNGSSTLRITGSIAQVNAKLATLAYSGSTVGEDTLTVVTLDATGTLSVPVRTPLTIVPFRIASSPAIVIDHGTLTLDTRIVDGPALMLEQAAGSLTAATVILVNTVLSPRSSLSIRNNNPLGTVMPRLAVAGHVELQGSTSFIGDGTAVTIARNGTLSNEGAMLIDAPAAQFTGTGTLVNDGLITVEGNGAATGTVRIDTSIGGVGRITLNGSASLSLRTVAATETVSLGDGAQTLHLTDPAAFNGMIAGFSHNDAVVLDGTTVSAAFYSTTSATTEGTLALFSGQTAVGSLRFTAPEAGTIFQLSTDASGTSSIRLAAVPAIAQTASTNVYRFFDATRGTQLLTSDPTERDQIIGTHPDLRFEGVAFGAVAHPATDAGAVAVYRFFDTTNGTHLLTANATERDTLLSTRPDLVFEPTSTMFEHASAQANDVAVYRFFDQRSGAHFFTDDASERATILSIRPDLTPEGIAFYAPRT